MNLLIVDDEYYHVESLKMKVEKLRPVFDEIFCAYNLKQALTVFRAEEVSIMICDVEMPGGSGLELLNHIREQNLPTICIFLTAYARFDYISQAMKLSSIDYLLKPVDDEQLAASLDKALEQYRKQRQALETSEQVNRLKENEITLLKQYWMELLEQEKLEQLESAAYDYLSSLSRSQPAEEKYRTAFYQSFLSLLSGRLRSLGEEDAFSLFAELSGQESMERTCASFSSLRQWVPGILALYQNCRQTAANTENAIAAVKAYIHSHLTEKLDRDSLAARVYLSPDYLSHCFKARTGVSLTNYIIGERIDEAKRLLARKDMNVRDIAISCGFQNISYFTRQFKKSTGMTPKEYRARC